MPSPVSRIIEPQISYKLILLLFAFIFPMQDAWTMQNPIYSGVNRIELSCPDKSSIAQSLCSNVQQALETQMQLKVSMTSATAPKRSTKLVPLGVLQVELELHGTPTSQARLIWTNTKSTGPNPTREIGDWFQIEALNPSQNELATIAQKLVGDAP